MNLPFLKAPTLLLVWAAIMLGAGAVTGQPEFILPALVLGGASATTKYIQRQKQIARSLAQMEKQLYVTHDELEATTNELQKIRVEREFDRELLRPPKDLSA